MLMSHVVLDNMDIKVSEAAARKIFHTAYADRFSPPSHWRIDPLRYLVVIEGRLAIAAYEAAKIGDNPWEAALREYVSTDIR